MSATRGRSAERLRLGLADQEQEERRRAARVLLRHPLLTPLAPDPAAFVLARRHARWLAEWFSREAGWTLVDDSSVVRLRKSAGTWADATRPAATVTGARHEFGRRRYVLLCLALAVLERAESQITLGRMVDQVVGLAADATLAEAGITFTMSDRAERGDLAAVARLLLSLGVLVRVAGDEQAFVDATGDVLYDVDRTILSTLLIARRGPSMIDRASARTTPDRIAAVLAEPAPDTDDARNRAIRVSLSRRLLDDPVVYHAHLDPAERDYLATQRGPLLRRLADGTGLVPEVRAEGIALVDPTGDATDLGMPEEGTDGHATLLVAERLARHLRERHGEGLPLAVLHDHVRDLARRHQTYWRHDTQEPGAERVLTTTALTRLHRLGLIAPPPLSTSLGGPADAEHVVPLPALGRFRYAPFRVSAPGERS
ncbi:MAG: TIGR02678 family protein [Kineosporiaceae bacterium]